MSPWCGGHWDPFLGFLTQTAHVGISVVEGLESASAPTVQALWLLAFSSHFLYCQNHKVALVIESCLPESRVQIWTCSCLFQWIRINKSQGGFSWSCWLYHRLQSSKNQGGGREKISSRRKTVRICSSLETNMWADVYAYHPSTKLLYDSEGKLLVLL